MKYIYLDREEAKKGITLVKAVLEKRNEEYKKKYVEFIGDDIPHFITFLEETDSIREATEEEKLARKQIELADNEVIIDNVIYSYDKKYQKVVNNQIVNKTAKELIAEGLITLEDVKKQKREELKKIRNQKIEENIEVYGSVFQVRNSDKEHFDDVDLMIRTNEINENYKKNWVLADNSVKEFTAQQIIDVWKERTKRKDKIFIDFGSLSMKLQSCNSVEEIEKIKWK
ncbi:DUF4376 domain-containing protein [Fusobacterium necrophorum subsp. funduliforme]